MLALDDDHDPLRVHLLDERVGNLRGQALLHLQAMRVELDQARELGDAAHAPRFVGNVGDVREAVERDHMVLAHREDGDVVHDDHFLVPLVELLHEQLRRVGRHAGENLLVHLGDTLGRFEQPLAVRVLPHALEYEAHALLDLLVVHGTSFLGKLDDTV